MKILFVCLGNICRSPLAEGIMRAKILKYNLNIEVDSAGTGAWHAGEHPDKRAIAIAGKYGVDISQLRASKFCVEDFDRFDKIYVMDLQNKRDVLNLTSQNAASQKVELILNIPYPTTNAEVPDPWFGGNEDFDEVFRLLDYACERLVEILKNTDK